VRQLFVSYNPPDAERVGCGHAAVNSFDKG
jgi:PTS system nitrogen regulatory IIA component